MRSVCKKLCACIIPTPMLSRVCASTSAAIVTLSVSDSVERTPSTICGAMHGKYIFSTLFAVGTRYIFAISTSRGSTASDAAIIAEYWTGKRVMNVTISGI